MRIYMDESYDAQHKYLLLGALFIPGDSDVNRPIWDLKEREQYGNRNPKFRNKWKEFHFSGVRTPRDVRVGTGMVDVFKGADCWMRIVAIDWSRYDASFFGDPFESDSLKERRAYKKWAELLLQPEVRERPGGDLFLDELNKVGGYDILDHLRNRFVADYQQQGAIPRLARLQMVRSRSDEHQGSQLCDLLVSAVLHSLIPGSGKAACRAKCGIVDSLSRSLEGFGVGGFGPSFWKGHSKKTLRKAHPKFSVWYWEPDEERVRNRRRKNLRRYR